MAGRIVENHSKGQKYNFLASLNLNLVQFSIEERAFSILPADGVVYNSH